MAVETKPLSMTDREILYAAHSPSCDLGQLIGLRDKAHSAETRGEIELLLRRKCGIE